LTLNIRDLHTSLCNTHLLKSQTSPLCFCCTDCCTTNPQQIEIVGFSFTEVCSILSGSITTVVHVKELMEQNYAPYIITNSKRLLLVIK